jgi:hypothetical protein
MKKSLFLLIIFSVATTSYALTGISAGVKGGQAMKTDLGPVEGLADIDNMTLLGAQLKIATLPMVDFIGTIEYAWADAELTGIPGKLKVHDLGLTVSVVYPFNMPVLNPYAGIGIGTHRVSYSVELSGVPLGVPLPADAGHLGYHLIGGADLELPALPFGLMVEARINWVETDRELTRYFQITGGVNFGL